jgi:hypothetical protein
MFDRYKNGKSDEKVWGLWSGSSLHFMELVEGPGWEDYDIEYLSRNRFQYLGFGKSNGEILGADLAYYLTPPKKEMVGEAKKIGMVTPLKLRTKWKPPEFFVVNSACTQKLRKLIAHDRVPLSVWRS